MEDLREMVDDTDPRTYKQYGSDDTAWENVEEDDASQVQQSAHTQGPSVREETHGQAHGPRAASKKLGRPTVTQENRTGHASTQSLVFIDPTPRTPRASSPSKAPDTLPESEDESVPTPEIKHIMEQFGNADCDEAVEEAESLPKREMHLKDPVMFPLRRSSLEPGAQKPSAQGHGNTRTDEVFDDHEQSHSEKQASSPPLPKRISSLPDEAGQVESQRNSVPSKPSLRSLPKELPPTPDPEPDLPFDFHRFLEQLRHRTADPVAKYLRSFLTEFGKKQWTASEQVKFVSDFLTFIANKMAQCDVWRGISDAEFDNAREGMEKLVMNRLYSQTFSPAIPLPTPIHPFKGKQKDVGKLLGAGRRGQHQEDIERDEILSQKVRIYNWVQEEHLDVKAVGSNSKRLLDLAQQELLKIRNYRAPRDKVICILNSCKVIFGLLRNSKSSDTSADAFVPLLILVVLHANPEHLVSNVQYILRFRNEEKLGGEAGYYLSSLMGAIQFIETLDRTSLTVSDEEFEKKVEHAVSAIAERNQHPMQSQATVTQPSGHVRISEKSAPSQPQVAPQHSAAAEAQRLPFREKLQLSTGRDGSDDDTAVNGLLRTIQRPLTNLGRMFSEDGPVSNAGPQPSEHPPQPPRRLSPAIFQPPRHDNGLDRQEPKSKDPKSPDTKATRTFRAEDAAARQASAEAAEAQRIQQAEHQNVVETLAGMFPELDRDVIDDVVRVKQGRVGLAVDACLALHS